ncbi:MAG: F0F1 ATP synthase subunit A, partial [Pseudomonadales bacterium]
MAAGHDDKFHHVRDAEYFELPFGGHFPPNGFPEIAGLQITKFMVLQVIAFVLALVIFWGLARRVRNGEPVKGRWWNFWEMLALFIRDQVVRPTIGRGHHDHADSEHSHDDRTESSAATADAEHPLQATGHPADKFLPLIWSFFFYILFCNLLGAIPWLGSPTSDVNVTAALALVAFAVVVISGSAELGVVGFWKALVPSMDLPRPMMLVMVPALWSVELLGLLIKHGVLAIRLFANIMAGHTVIAVILGFIAGTAYAPDAANPDTYQALGLW